VNIIAGKTTVVPNWSRTTRRRKKLAAEVKAILSDRQRSDAIRGELAGIRQKLASPAPLVGRRSWPWGLMRTGSRVQGTGYREEGEKT